MDRPGFVAVHATKYLPSTVSGENITDNSFVEREQVHFSTKMDRGADLGEMNSVCLLKYPRPNTQDPLLKAMKKRLGDSKFWDYYQDMSRREFIQQIGRIMRSPDAEKEFWSPDEICHKKLKKHWSGKIRNS
jgi:hypothetical protein